MTKKGVIALMACVFALCLALVGCGDNAAANKAAFTGTWDLVEMNQDGQVTGSDDLETLKSLGLEVYVNLNEDGTAALVLFGEAMNGNWEATSTTAGTITLDNQKVDMTIEDSKLKFAQENASLTFQKGEAKEVPSSSSSATASAEGESSAASESTASESASASAESGSAAAESSSAAAEGSSSSSSAAA